MERIEGQWVRMQDSVGAGCSWGSLVDSFLVMQRSKEPCISWFRLGRKSKGLKIIVLWNNLNDTGSCEVVLQTAHSSQANHLRIILHTGTWSRFDLFTLFVPFVRLGTPGSIHGGTTEGVNGHGLLQKGETKSKHVKKCTKIKNINLKSDDATKVSTVSSDSAAQCLSISFSFSSWCREPQGWSFSLPLRWDNAVLKDSHNSKDSWELMVASNTSLSTAMLTDFPS